MVRTAVWWIGACLTTAVGASAEPLALTFSDDAVDPQLEICAPGAAGPACLAFSCADTEGALALDYAEPGSLPGFGRMSVTLALDGVAEPFDVRLDARASDRRGAVGLDAEGVARLRAAFETAESLSIDHGEGRWIAAIPGEIGAAFTRLDDACAPPEPVSTEPLPLAGLSGVVPVVLDPEGWPAASGTVKALVTGAHGFQNGRHWSLFRTPTTIPAARAFNAGPGRYLLFAELCGAKDWYGPNGCGLHVSFKTGGRWNLVTVRPAEEVLSLDMNRVSAAGWPEITGPEGRRWVWQADAYQPAF